MGHAVECGTTNDSLCGLCLQQARRQAVAENGFERGCTILCVNGDYNQPTV